MVPIRVEEKTITVNCNDYLVEILMFGDWKAKRLVGFSQGFLAHPIFYKEFLEGIAKNDALVVAPNVNGVKIKNYDNGNFKSCQEMVGNSLEFFLKGSLFDKGYDLLIGHSTGAASVQSERIEYPKTVLINPLMPVDYNPGGFCSKAIRIGFNQFISGNIKAVKHLFSPEVKAFYAMKGLTNLTKNLALVRDFSNNGSLDYFYPKKENIEALILYGGNLEEERDEFFDFGRNKDKLKSHFRTLGLQGIKGGHEELMYNSSFFLKKTLEFLG
ncbi:MAG: hypothetical protein Q7S27_06480 [Nanoarchaeota archaeon]|nr:hypothetical protein [Nanoarchaeota archaeon]